MKKRTIFRFSVLSISVLALAFFFIPLKSERLVRARIEPKIPDIPGYQTLLCDFHIHTVFSDGSVWPTVRVEEAWREGLDAIAITDHLEYHPWKEDIRIAHNRAFEVAEARAKDMGLLLIRGTEITKKTPPGHFNAIFLKDADPVFNDNYLEACRIAAEQGAFVFWNHPTFGGNVKGGEGIWHPEHTAVLEKGWLHGIEVVNGRTYYPESQRWCREKNLTMMGTTDIHNALNLEYDPVHGDLRPMNLVFASEKSETAIKEALFARRTAVYNQGTLYGESRFLKPIFNESISIVNPAITVKGKSRVTVQVKNTSDITYRLTADGELPDISFPASIDLVADATVTLTVQGKDSGQSGSKTISLPYKVQNLNPVEGETLPVTLKLTVKFASSDN